MCAVLHSIASRVLTHTHAALCADIIYKRDHNAEHHLTACVELTDARVIKSGWLFRAAAI